MGKRFTTLAIALAAMLTTTGIAVSAQTGREPAPNHERSRLLPPEALPKRGGPPPIETIAPPVIRASGPEQAPSPRSNADILELSNRCLDVVSPSFQINAKLLTDNGWGYTAPRRQNFGQFQGEIVEYHKNDEAIVLIDAGQFVICRVIVPISAHGQFDSVRETLKSKLPGVNIAELPKDNAYRARMINILSKDQVPNFIVAKGYTFELRRQRFAFPEAEMLGASEIELLMVEIGPLPPAFRQHQKSK